MKSRHLIIGAVAVIAGLLAALAFWRDGGPAPQSTAGKPSAPLTSSPEKTFVWRLGSFASPLPDGPFPRTFKLPGIENFSEQTAKPHPGAPTTAPNKDSARPDAPPDAAHTFPGTPTMHGQPEAWARNAMPGPANPAHLPLIAIVIDDLGIAPEHIQPAVHLPAAMTMAVLPYAHAVVRAAAESRLRGHEVLVHLPMEADGEQDPGAEALLAGLTPLEFNRRVQWNLSRFEGYIGINNHMGSRLTRDSAAMGTLMAEVKRRGLLFLDSRTAAHTVAASTARALGVTALTRDVFLDNDITPENVRAQLHKAEEIALRKGYAIAIGHPHPVTVEVLAQWATDLEARGFVLAPLSAVARLTMEKKRLVPLPPSGR